MLSDSFIVAVLLITLASVLSYQTFLWVRSELHTSKLRKENNLCMCHDKGYQSFSYHITVCKLLCECNRCNDERGHTDKQPDCPPPKNILVFKKKQ